MLPAPELDSRGVRREGSEAPLSLLGLGLSVAKLALNISCIECTGPDMPVLTDLLSQAQAVEDTTRVANDVLDYVTRFLEGEFLDVALDRLVADSKMQCSFTPGYNKDAVSPVYAPFESPARDDSIDFLVALAITALLLVMGLSILLLATKLLVRRRHRKWINYLSGEKVLVLSRQQHHEDAKEKEINASTGSLFTSTEIPPIVRYVMPVVILGNIAFFLSGHLSLGGSVSIIVTLAGESYVADNFFEFSMAKSTVDIWNGKFGTMWRLYVQFYIFLTSLLVPQPGARNLR
jgi:hypothetical protein